MKKCLPVVGLLFVLGFTSCNGGKNSSRIPAYSNFITVSSGNDCGVSERLSVFEISRFDIWLARFLDNEKSPHVVAHIVKAESGTHFKVREFWVDKKSDGKFEEYFDSFESFDAKYPNGCIK